ncbi:MAG: hypothetical protein IOC63_21045 [Methylobacterium sp.]|nr:hypothetical protein [Methylobacterium sp.]MCA4910708.1 hypothetical protein [Methylobacterium sp.]
MLAVYMLGFISIVDYLQADQDAAFQLYGLNSALAAVGMVFAAVVLFSRGPHQASTGRLLGVLSLGGFAVFAFFGWLINLLGPVADGGLLQWPLFGLSLGLPLLMIIWTGFGARQVFRLDGTVRRPLARGLGFGAALWLGYAVVPHWPIFESGNFRRETANYWELASALRTAWANTGATDAARTRNEGEESRTAVEMAQPERLDAALSALEARKPGQPNIFVLGLSGWGGQQVFAREITQSLAILDRRFGTSGRTIRLANNAADKDSYPLANVQNIAAAIRGLASRMDREQDVLLITMTSHGAQSGFALQNEGLVQRLLHPEALRIMLDRAGIRNRILLVSACYSGVFIPAFADEGTAVITASAADRTSFGCSDHRNWTYFGEAFFENGLRETGTLTEAFAMAEALVTKWETEQNLPPSRPQIHIGQRLRQHLPFLIGGTPPARAAMAPADTP